MHKMYVNVVVHISDEGRIDPLSVIWPDGRVYRIDEILYRGQPGQLQKGAKTARYRVRFGRHETDLYLESKQGNPALGTPRQTPLVGKRRGHNLARHRELSRALAKICLPLPQ